MKRLYAIITFTALLGWMPIMLGLIAVDFALDHGARDWSDFTFGVVFGCLYLALVVIGSYVFVKLKLRF